MKVFVLVHLAHYLVKIVIWMVTVLNVDQMPAQFQLVNVTNTISLTCIKEKKSVKSVTSDVEIVITFSITVLTVLLKPEDLTHQCVPVPLVY
jgi:hypothetical protein